VCSPKDQGGLGVHDLEVKNTALLGKWLFKLLTEEGGKPFLRGNTLVKKLYLGFYGNRGIRIFGLDSWQQRSFSLVWVPFLLRMVRKYGSRKIDGLVMPLFGNSILPCTAL
jgi:hypothetical protein